MDDAHDLGALTPEVAPGARQGGDACGGALEVVGEEHQHRQPLAAVLLQVDLAAVVRLSVNSGA